MEQVLAGLRAAAEQTRLRLLFVLRQGDLTVSELTHILGQSQPRVSRHLKLMCEAGLLERFREGAWVFYRLSREGIGAEVAQRLVDLLPPEDSMLALDQERLGAVKRARSESAALYFRDNAAQWDQLRSLHVDDSVVEKALLDAFAGAKIGSLLDIGTGTGRILALLCPMAEEGLGVDASREMLAVARDNLERAGMRNCSIRQGDMYNLALPNQSFDAITVHQVLHYADDPASVVAEAARLLRPNGLLAMVDFAPHELEYLREEHQHRRLGFSDAEVRRWCRDAGLVLEAATPLPGDPLTVTIWLARRPAAADGARNNHKTGAAA